VGIAEHDVDSRLAPPAKIQRGQAAGKLPRMVLAQEKIVVVELYGVDAVGRLLMPEKIGRPLRRLHFLTAENRNYSAEIAAEWAPDACLVHGGARTEKCRQDVL